MLVCDIIVIMIVGASLVAADGCCDSRAFRHPSNGDWWQFFDCPRTHAEAQRICQTRMIINGRTTSGGNLASIRSSTEAGWVQYYLNAHYGKLEYGVWIGLVRRTQFGQCANSWRWLDGSNSNYRRWDQGQPNCRWPPAENCVHIIDNNIEWNDAECQIRLRFICRRRATVTPNPPFFLPAANPQTSTGNSGAGATGNRKKRSAKAAEMPDKKTETDGEEKTEGEEQSAGTMVMGSEKTDNKTKETNETTTDKKDNGDMPTDSGDGSGKGDGNGTEAGSGTGTVEGEGKKDGAAQTQGAGQEQGMEAKEPKMEPGSHNGEETMAM